MQNYTSICADIQYVLSTLNTMTGQILANHPRKTHIAADMAALVDEWLPVATRAGLCAAACVMQSYYAYRDTLTSDIIIER